MTTSTIAQKLQPYTIIQSYKGRAGLVYNEARFSHFLSFFLLNTVEDKMGQKT
jgi:hypothetical protein